MSEFRELLAGVNILSICVRLFLALLFSGVLGLERGIKRRPAGMRTYMLVCIGSTLVMITNQYVAEMYELVDPTRMGAQVISGIGFLGVGTIIVTRERQVKGLTTAAGLWANACMGLAIGIGFYEGAILGTAFIFLAITIMHGLDSRVLSQSRAVEVYVELTEDSKLSAFLESLHQNDYEVSHIEIVKAKYGEHKGIAAIISLWLPHRQAHYEVIDQLNQTKAIDYIEEI